jgi:hypothetical protein
VTTSSEGFINVSSDATVFRFHDVILNSGPAVMDSTILLLMSIVDRISDTDDEFVKKLNEETYNKYKFILNKENHTIEVYIKNSYVGLLFETTKRKSLRFVNSNDEEVLIHKCRNYANVA